MGFYEFVLSLTIWHWLVILLLVEVGGDLMLRIARALRKPRSTDAE